MGLSSDRVHPFPALPSPDLDDDDAARAAAYGRFVAELQERSPQADDRIALSALLAEVRRRASRLGHGDSIYERAEKALTGALTQALTEAARTEAVEASKVPLRRRILRRLLDAPASGVDVAAVLGVERETVSRILRPLEDEGLIVRTADEDDRRRRLNAITEAGIAHLNRYEAFDGGERPASASPISQQTFLFDMVNAAVEERREGNQLPAVEARLRVVIREAEKRDAPSLSLMARKELLTALRQLEDHKGHEVELTVLDHLVAHATRPEDVLPAFAHSEYERARQASPHEPEQFGGRLRRSISAADAYLKLRVQDSEGPDDWGRRYGWALLCQAEILREVTRLGDAIARAGHAELEFVRAGDAYGAWRAWYLQGVSHRLRGEYEPAERHLRRVLVEARSHSFDRLTADALTQLGEVQRCAGNANEAKATLNEACHMAGALRLQVTLGFAQCGLGATMFDLEDYGVALEHLARAHEVFTSVDHDEGLALNHRRFAVIARHELGSSAPIGPDSAMEHIALALLRYERLQSPAGWLACQVERGELEIELGRSPDAVTDRLTSLLAHDRRGFKRHLVALDPWVPALIRKFADRAQHEVLVELAEWLLPAPDDGWTFGFGAADTPSRHPEPRAVDSSTPPLVASRRENPMAGEPRRDADLTTRD
jgi:DNA-binding MarR family transcriptional regulator